MNSLVQIETPFALGPRLIRYPRPVRGNLRSSYVPASCMLLWPLIALPAAYAVCRSPRTYVNILANCLDRNVDANNNVVVQLRDGMRTHNGRLLRAAADVCAADLAVKREWDKWSAGCSDMEYVTIAKAEIENGRASCDRYSQ